jgi:hypothetical protein
MAEIVERIECSECGASMSCNYDWRHKQVWVRYVRESDYSALLERLEVNP